MKKILILSAAVLFSAACYSQKPIVLNLKKGETYLQNSVVDSKISQQVQGNNMEVSMLLSSNIAYKIIDKVDTVYNVEMTLVNLKSSVTSQFGSQTMDTDQKKDGDPLSNILHSIAGKPFKATITNTGKVISIECTSVIKSAIAANNIPDAQKGMLETQLGQIIGDKVLKDQIESSFLMCTKQPVKKGSKWGKVYDAQRMISFRMNNNFEIIEETPEAYIVKYSAEINTDPNAPTANVNGMDAKYSLNGNLDGTMNISKSTGWVIETKANQLVKGTIDILPNNQIPEGIQVPMSINTTSTISNK